MADPCLIIKPDIKGLTDDVPEMVYLLYSPDKSKYALGGEKMQDGSRRRGLMAFEGKALAYLAQAELLRKQNLRYSVFRVPFDNALEAAITHRCHWICIIKGGAMVDSGYVASSDVDWFYCGPGKGGYPERSDRLRREG